MSIAIVLLRPEDEAPMADFLAQNCLPVQMCWRISEEGFSAESLLPALEAAFHSAVPDMVLFPPSVEGDELATRLAWRLHGSAICQALSWDSLTGSAKKAVYGNALTAALRPERHPVCLSLSTAISRRHLALPGDLGSKIIVPVTLPGALPLPEILSKSAHPLQSAKRVLATGQGAASTEFEHIAKILNAEIGYTRQRVMAGGCDEQRMLGVSGQSVAPEVCLIAGASGASAFMAGVTHSQFIVAINTDPAAPVFAAADVGIVGDAQEVLQMLAECATRVN
jgi:electron transfer flavoprotein alpha subunit